MARLNHGMAVVVSFAVIVGALAATPAQADPIVVTSGDLNFFVFDSISVLLNGNSAELAAQLGGPGAVPPYACGSGCAGQMLNLSVNGSFPSGNGNLVEGAMIVGGNRSTLDSFVFDITAGSILAPANGTVSTAFSFLATSRGTPAGGVSNTFDWAGSGIATARFGPDGWASTDYTFASAASPSPEPASLVLLGTGIAGLVARRFRHRVR